MKIKPFKDLRSRINNTNFYQNNKRDTDVRCRQYNSGCTNLPYGSGHFNVYFGKKNIIEAEKSLSWERRKLNQIITMQQRSLGFKDIEKLVSEVSEVSSAPENEVIYSLDILTQFANMKNLDKMVKIIGDNYDCKEFFCTFDGLFPENKTFNYGLALSYYQAEKEQLKLNPNGTKKAFVLDEMGFKYLENLDDCQRKQLMDTVVFINALGWEQGFNIFDQTNDMSLFKSRAIELIRKVKEKQGNLSYEEALKKELTQAYEERLEKYGINDIKIVSLVDFNQKISDRNAGINKIVGNITPKKITPEEIEEIVDVLLNMFKYDPEIMTVPVLKYLNSELDIYTPQRMGDEFKNIKKRIDFKIKELKEKNPEIDEKEVYYILPNNYKSFIATTMHFARVNNIDFSKIVFLQDNVPTLKDNAIYVLLDDFIATGHSFNDYFYDCLNLRNSELNPSYIFMCPMISTDEGVAYLNNKICEKHRKDNDFVIVDEVKKKSRIKISAFYPNNPSEQNKNLFKEFLDSFDFNLCNTYGTMGKGDFGFAICFPYMSPDNDAKFPSLIFERLLLNPKAENSLKNKCSPVIKKYYDLEIQKRHPEWSLTEVAC